MQFELFEGKPHEPLKIFFSKTVQQNSEIFYPNSGWICVFVQAVAPLTLSAK